MEDFKTALAARLGGLPPVPETGFIGRSRELLALQRLLRTERYAVVRGQGGEGKTALAAEFARWMVRSQQMRRTAFVSVETHSHVAAVLDTLGRQLVGKDYSVATFENLETAILPVARILREQPTLLVMDNMESILLPPWLEVERVPLAPAAAAFLTNGASDSAQGVERAPLAPAAAASGSGATLEALNEDMRRELDAILALCARLLKVGDTRLIFTSREALPAPFAADRNRRELHRLDREDAVKLVERVLNAEAGSSGRESAPFEIHGDQSRLTSAATMAAADARREEIEQLVDAVHAHARTLALLAPALRSRGVEATRESLVELMAEMEKRFPGSREQSVFASVELSLRRMSPENWGTVPTCEPSPPGQGTRPTTCRPGALTGRSTGRALALGVFHGGVDLDVLKLMTQWEEADVASLARELIATGLATLNRYNHLTLNPALCPYLRGRMGSTGDPPVPNGDSPLGTEPALGQSAGPSAGERAAISPGGSPGEAGQWPAPPNGWDYSALTARWVEAMRAYAGFLVQQQHQNAEVAATLTVLELPSLFALLDLVQAAGDAEATIGLATSLYSLLSMLGKPRLLERVGQVRDAAAAALGDAWNHARFEAARTRIEQQEAGGQLRDALEGAQQLLQRARAAGGQAYPGADYDLAMAHFTLARVLQTAGGSEQALPPLDEARQRFEAVAKEQANKAAEGMASACLTEQGECLLLLGRLDDAAAAYEEAIRRDEQRGADRDVAVGKGQLGTVRMYQRRYPEALAAYTEARERFTQLDEPGTVAVIWHQTGMVYQKAGQPEAAEDAYRKSLAIDVRLGDVAGQAGTLSATGEFVW